MSNCPAIQLNSKSKQPNTQPFSQLNNNPTFQPITSHFCHLLFYWLKACTLIRHHQILRAEFMTSYRSPKLIYHKSPVQSFFFLYVCCIDTTFIHTATLAFQCVPPY